MLSKTRTTTIALIAAFSVAGIAAVPAGAARSVCNIASSGVLVCHQAKGCTATYEHANGTVSTVDFADGEETIAGGRKYKCNDGKWEAAAGGGRQPQGEQPKNTTGPGSAPPAQGITPPPPAGSHP